MKILHFIDTGGVGTDEHFVPAKNITLVEMENNSTVKVWWKTRADFTDDMMDITCTAGMADNLLLTICEHMIDSGVSYNAIPKFADGEVANNSYGFTGAISNMAFTAGSDA